MGIDSRLLLMQVNDVASLPMIFMRIDESVNRPTSSMRDIAIIISEDMGLSARILRLANSAFYGYPRQIETITEALTIIGIREMRDLALATTIMGMFNNIPEQLLTTTSFWQHNVACGVAARILATHRRESNVEKFFVGGVLHDIGRLMLCQHAPEEMTSVLIHGETADKELVKIEKEILGIDHAALGGALMERWNLPDSLQEMVAFHHRPSAAERFPEFAAIIHLANLITHVMQLGASGNNFIPKLDEAAWKSLKFTPSVFPLVFDQVQAQYASAMAFFMGDQAD
ncbi:MAG: HDOD domain-containing protein [Candidatus Neomarinimicrobiota bacterium]